MTTTCSNPNCTCSPCLCGEECKCRPSTALGDLERQVMDVLWGGYGRELTGRDVADALPAYAFTTVATVLNRLSRKGDVRKRMEDGKARFAAIHTQADRAATTMRNALSSSDDRRETLARFTASMTADEVEALRAFLDARR